MKFTIKFGTEFSLEFSLRRTAAGGWEVAGLYPTFLDRRGKPHVTLMADAVKPVHFTAFGGSSKPFRRKLTKRRPVDFRAPLEKAGAEVYSAFVDNLRPADLHALRSSGWTFHGINFRAVARWMRPVCHPGGTLEVSEEVLWTLMAHLAGTRFAPEALLGISEPAVFVLMHWRDDVEDSKAETLMHFPDGVWLEQQDEVVQVRPPGWYRLDAHRSGVFDPIDMAGVDTVVKKALECADRFPRKSSSPSWEGSALPPAFMFALAHYAGDLARVALNLAVDRAT